MNISCFLVMELIGLEEHQSFVYSHSLDHESFILIFNRIHIGAKQVLNWIVSHSHFALAHSQSG